jgi:hypothetical protein
MSKEIKFTTVAGNPDIYAEFWMRDTKVEVKRLTAEEEDGLMEAVDFDIVRQGTTVSVDASTIQRLIESGEVQFFNDDGDWTNFEAILYDLMNESE